MIARLVNERLIGYRGHHGVDALAIVLIFLPVITVCGYGFLWTNVFSWAHRELHLPTVVAGSVAVVDAVIVVWWNRVVGQRDPTVKSLAKCGFAPDNPDKAYFERVIGGRS